jgi:ribosomal protein RSM22 (predicted rRNA methylase)
MTLREALEQACAGLRENDLRPAARALTDAYRSGGAAPLQSDLAIAAYAITRMPATHAAVRRVLSEVPDAGSALDLGAGTGASAWAIRERFGAIPLTLVERNAAVNAWARRLDDPAWLRTGGDLGQTAFPEADLAVLSYAAGELTNPLPVVLRAWKAARRHLVLIEPGTPRGFALIRQAREALISEGARVLAPCPHGRACPMTGEDWCHFAARVERSALHRRLKGGDLGYEDEKFSYAVVSRETAGPGAPRVLRHPRIEAGLVQLQLCTPDGLASRAVRARDRAEWKRARKAAWGDLYTERALK